MARPVDLRSGVPLAASLTAASTAAAPAVVIATSSLQRSHLPVTVAGSTALLVLMVGLAGLAAPVLARTSARVTVSVTGVLAAAAALGVGAGGAGVAGLAAYSAAGGLAMAAAAGSGGRGVERPLALTGVAAAVMGVVVAVAATTGWRVAFDVAGVLHAAAVVLASTRSNDTVGPAADPSEARRRVLRTPTVRALLTANGVLGVLLLPVAFQATVLLDHDRAPAREQAMALVAVAVGLGGGVAMARRLTASSGGASAALRVARLAVWATGVALVVTSVVPKPLLFVGLLAAGGTAGLALSVVSAVLVAAVPQGLSTLALRFAALWRWTFGGIGGLVLAAVFRNRFGEAVALAMLAAPGLLGVRALHRAEKTADADVLRVEIEETEPTAQSAGSPPAKLLECSGIDFCYGPVQVLFDVAFTVDEGEMVALLGTNGAGKSTLLRVVSGLGLPVRGSVRFAGEDITFLDPDRRLRRGVAQIPGGKAVFGPMSVVDNLRAYGFTHGRDRRAVERGIDASFDAFPRLHERRNQQAGTLSGGEQQMLALSKAFMLRPRLLLIDELSLGLAPKVVGELLEMVRRINAEGTAVVLVEQSVNVALSLVHHAYFMEKGAVQFDGAADELLARGDLLRSVFLEGAASGLAR